MAPVLLVWTAALFCSALAADGGVRAPDTTPAAPVTATPASVTSRTVTAAELSHVTGVGSGAGGGNRTAPAGTADGGAAGTEPSSAAGDPVRGRRALSKMSSGTTVRPPVTPGKCSVNPIALPASF